MQASKCLNLAGKLRVFSICDASPSGELLPNPQQCLTCSELSSALGLCQDTGFRGVADFLDLLVSLHTLERTGTGCVHVHACVCFWRRWEEGRPV
eukprot:1117626-Pelagomonas_calceolata.AAC.2